MKLIQVILLAVTFMLTACGGSKISSNSNIQIDEAITHIAIMPGSGVLGDAVGIELFNRGYTVFDADQTGVILGRINLQEHEAYQTKGLNALRAQGIKAVLIAKSVGGYDEAPESASVRITSTLTGKIIVGVVWQNAWGGAKGSPADGIMRKNLLKAAEEISEEIAQRLNQS